MTDGLDAARFPASGILMIAWGVLRLGLHLLTGLCTSAFIFPFVSSAGRDQFIKAWSARLLGILRVEVTVQHFADMHSPHSHSQALIVANHVSWLDIFVINTLQPCRFVAKADIRKWPVFGWLCEKAGTIFIARGKRREVRRVYEGLVRSIRAGERIAFFPEGTTTSQGGLLPFHSNLFEAAIEAGVAVQPYALRYVDEADGLHAAADFVGDMTFVESILLIAKARKMRAQLIMLPQIDTTGTSRGDIARSAYDAIAAALGYAGGSNNQLDQHDKPDQPN